MFEGLPFGFGTCVDDHFGGDSMASQNLNNPDPDLLHDEAALECDASFGDIDREDFLINNEEYMRVGYSFEEDPSSCMVPQFSNERGVACIPMADETPGTIDSPPRRPFERLVEAVIAGRVNVTEF